MAQKEQNITELSGQIKTNEKEAEIHLADNFDGDFIDVYCPRCGEMLSFHENEIKGVCIQCGTEFDIE